MSRRVFRQRPSLIDLDEAANYLQQEGGPHLAIRFLREVDATLQSLAAIPGLGARYEAHGSAVRGSACLSRLTIPEISRLLPAVQDGIEVLRVLHGARDIKGLLAGGFEISFDEDDPPHEVPDTS